MIITISGTLGSGEKSVAMILARKLKMSHHSGGEFIRNIAERRDISLEEFTKIAEKDTSIDLELDHTIAEDGITKDNFIIDAKLGFHFIQKSVKIFLDADFDERVRRRFTRDIRNELNVTLESVANKLRKIHESDKKRFLEKYNVDFTDPKNYNLIIDTTCLSLQEVADKIETFLKSFL
ncbi:MAG: cytidylate kinase family protein [Nanoarchaeota archaeon]|nr:cytidylate kinase family protein [Nanoarchaeota archaeon]